MSRRPELTSVVVPVRNAEAVLGRQLEALATQDHEGEFEVVVADNGSSDGTRALAERWAAAGRGRTVIDAGGRPGAAGARNRGAAAARGEFIAFCDADDVVTPGWLRALTAAAPGAGIVAGRLANEALNGSLVRSWHHGAPTDRPLTGLGFLPFASGMNVGIWADLFRRLGGFDEHLPTGEDMDLSWRVQLAGEQLAFAPEAVVERRYRAGLRQLARQHYRYGRDGARLYRRYRDRGARRTPARQIASDWRWIVVHTPRAVRDEGERGVWVRRTALRVGRLAGGLRQGVFFQ